ncbi:MAG: DegT/DnrJ/EryC1/StrS family aminotransferase [Chthoniobacterales bacterium]|nr:MAG: DegT/DnrJ/EryC1/StrS family aminotransferase [Chthoniobacterales bacterium]
MILQNDFKRQWEFVEERAVGAVRRVGASGWFILGLEVEAFEKALAEFWGVAHAVGTGNGLDAIEIGLRCLKLQPGDKVLTTPLSAFATTLGILRAGGVPVFVDVNTTGGIDLQQCRDLLKRDNSIRFFVPVHLYGCALEMEELARLKSDFELRVVEDCAQSIGASRGGIRAGTVGQVAATSFYPTKNLGALGDAGALLTNDAAVAEAARSMRNYGQSAHYVHSEFGLNSRLDELHAAILRDAFLPNLTTWTDARRRTAKKYLDRIENPSLQFVAPSSVMDSVWHLFPTLVARGLREQFQGHLRARGIVTGVHYPRLIPEQTALKKGAWHNAMDPVNARRFAQGELSLPIHPFLTEPEVDAVIAACNDWKPDQS